MPKAISIEESFKKLDEIVSSLENGQESLEEAFKLYNEGIKIVKSCNTQLDKVEKQIIILDKNGDNDEF